MPINPGGFSRVWHRFAVPARCSAPPVASLLPLQLQRRQLLLGLTPLYLGARSTPAENKRRNTCFFFSDPWPISKEETMKIMEVFWGYGELSILGLRKSSMFFFGVLFFYISQDEVKRGDFFVGFFVCDVSKALFQGSQGPTVETSSYPPEV